MAAEYVDVLQIPAFLCRQTSLLVAAAQTGKVVNIKKGQFMSPEAMQFAAEKVREEGNPQVMLTERGVMFGYQDLVVDFRGIPVMQSFQAPVILDCTHSLQQPNQGSGVTGGRPALNRGTAIGHAEKQAREDVLTGGSVGDRGQERVGRGVAIPLGSIRHPHVGARGGVERRRVAGEVADDRRPEACPR